MELPKFRFYPHEEFIAMYNVIDIRFDEDMVVIEDDKNTSMLEVVEGDYHTSANGYPLYCYHIDEGTLMQYSGCKDINGKEVYEGDILMWYFDTIDNRSSLPDEMNKMFGIEKGDVIKLKHEDYELHEVIFDCGTFGIGSNFRVNQLQDIGKFEVIGNVHENPELLDT